ncbi:MAG TPA: helix-turn-helix transcriptional regulator [Rhizomicrobium sp.]|jgi:transcriptional regulator with XRE-family HTH domain|nr:helix-turn-helix transcriptional regulator [Rhizomicrobium sp.]
MLETSRKRSTNAIDHHVGDRIRAHREALEMNPEELAGTLGITVRQLQNYEMGRFRVGAATLFAMASQFAVPVTSFYEGLPATGVAPWQTALWQQFERLIETSEGVALMTLFPKIAASRYRRAVVEVVQAYLDGRVS